MTVHDVYVCAEAKSHLKGMYAPYDKNQRVVNVGEGLVGEYALSKLYDHVGNYTIWQTAEAREAALKDIDSIPEKVAAFLKKG